MDSEREKVECCGVLIDGRDCPNCPDKPVTPSPAEAPKCDYCGEELPHAYVMARMPLCFDCAGVTTIDYDEWGVPKAEAEIRQLREALEKARAVIEAVRAVGKRGHWDAPHWMLRVPAAEANALFDLAYAVDPELVAALAASTGQETPK